MIFILLVTAEMIFKIDCFTISSFNFFSARKGEGDQGREAGMGALEVKERKRRRRKEVVGKGEGK